MKSNNSYHTTVLLQEAVNALQIKKAGKYIDGTFGGGGHSEEILKRGGVVLGIDQDIDAIEQSQQVSKNNLKIVKGNFKNIKEIASENDFDPCSGILLDLGTSVHQIKESQRGFSFTGHFRLDMRMDLDGSLKAEEIINKWSKNDLAEIFEKFGEESDARIIAEEISNARKSKEIMFADELSNLVLKVKKNKQPGIHPATKVFQALRIVVNDEMNALKDVIEQGALLLEENGRFVIISFHSLEDRIVKQKFIELENKGLGRIVNKKPIRAGDEEIRMNKKSRSAKMRIFEKK